MPWFASEFSLSLVVAVSSLESCEDGICLATKNLCPSGFFFPHRIMSKSSIVVPSHEYALHLDWIATPFLFWSSDSTTEYFDWIKNKQGICLWNTCCISEEANWDVTVMSEAWFHYARIARIWQVLKFCRCAINWQAYFSQPVYILSSDQKSAASFTCLLI